MDKQLESGKEPTAKEMYGMASQLRVGKATIEQIGDVVTRGDKQYEIVGFDTDGVPLVEPVN